MKVIAVSHLWLVLKDDSPFWLPVCVSFLTLCFDVIHSWTRSFDGDLTWARTAPCVVYCPQPEPWHINTHTHIKMLRKSVADCEWYNNNFLCLKPYPVLYISSNGVRWFAFTNISSSSKHLATVLFHADVNSIKRLPLMRWDESLHYQCRTFH